nr:hypothetical protein [Pseudomonas oleovorans]
MSLEPFTVTEGAATFPRRPRQYAAAIVALKSKDERRAALAEAPEHLRALVRKHVENTWNHPQRKD